LGGWAAIGFAILGVALMAGSAAGVIDRTGAFFGAGTSLLVASLCLAAVRLRRPSNALIGGHGWAAVCRLGLRNAADRPGRSVLAIGVIASATFILISVDAFHKDRPSAADRHSGVGGYPLLVNLLLPMASDPNGREGREAIGLADVDRPSRRPFRVRAGTIRLPESVDLEIRASSAFAVRSSTQGVSRSRIDCGERRSANPGCC
jgi:hypothetical protein